MTPELLIVAGWLAAINLVTYGLFAIDKRRAVARAWRIPERSLLLCAALGGSPAAVLARRRLRHKTRKQPFRLYLNLVVTLQILCLPALVLAGLARA